MSAENSNTTPESKLIAQVMDEWMIHVGENETIKDALARFNESHNCSLEEDQIEDWRRLPVNDGFYLVSPNWNFEDLILEMNRKEEEAARHLIIVDKRPNAANPLRINGHNVPLDGDTVEKVIEDYAKGMVIEFTEKNTLMVTLSMVQ